MAGIAEVIDGIQAEFASELPADVVLARLQGLMRWEKGKLELVGEVKPDLIRMSVLHTFVRSNGTRFEGALVERARGVAIVGRFVASSLSRMAAGIFLLLAAFFAFGGLVGGLHDLTAYQHTALEALRSLAFVLAWAAGLGFFTYIQVWNASPTQKDIDVLSTAIREALLPEKT
jgi:hypothetical protein